MRKILFTLGILAGVGLQAQSLDPLKQRYDWSRINVCAPEGYVVNETHIISKVSKNRLGYVYDVAAVSENGQSVILYPIKQPMFIDKDKGRDCLDGYMSHIRWEVLQVNGLLDEHDNISSGGFFPNKFLTFVTGEEIRKAFCADKMCLFSAPIFPGMFKFSGKARPFDPDKYSHIVRIFWLKEGGYHYDVLLLLSDEAFSNRWEHIGNLFGTIRFDEDHLAETWEVIE